MAPSWSSVIALSIGILSRRHPERHPDGALAAFATDPGITLGLELRDSSIVCHAILKRGLSGSALVSGPVVSRGPARNEVKENPVRGADFERGKFSGEGPH